MERKCCKCKEEKALELFVKDKEKPQGRKTICKLCYSVRNKQWRANNLQKNRTIQLSYYYKNKAKRLAEPVLLNNLFGIEGLSRIEDGLKNL
jgi:hypothetical protein